MESNIDIKIVNSIRALGLDTIAKAKSGHPGIVLGSAPIIYTIYRYFLNYNPKDEKWINRDRFIMSAGHGSALLYSMLHLAGYNITIDDLKKFRQIGSITPGHPEFEITPGVEATTGPLGQGFAMGVGIALAENILNNFFGNIIDHYTYALVSDGELMEGVTSEAASLAGNLQLGKLIYLYDSNGISLDGELSLSFTEDVEKRFKAYNWQTLIVENGNCIDDIKNAIKMAQKESNKPSLIIIKTHIGYGSPFQDTNKVHGSPILGDDLKTTKQNLGTPPDKEFFVEQDFYNIFKNVIDKNQEIYDKWLLQFELLKRNDFEKYDLLKKFINNHINEQLIQDIIKLKFEDTPTATRSISQTIMNKIEESMFEFIGGSADLSSSTKTVLKQINSVGYGKKFEKNIFYGVREHAMGAITNGLALHGGIIPYCSTFLVFSDYMRPAIREAALMNLPSIFVFTHDSILVGEDGPTHQPIEQIPSLRLIPNLIVYRPADSKETAAVWYYAITLKKPTVIILTRQKVEQLKLDYKKVFSGVGRGAYIVKDFEENDNIKIIIVATGSELMFVLKAIREVKYFNIRVVSMPSLELFNMQTEQYKEQILPKNIENRIIVEASSNSSLFSQLSLSKTHYFGVNQFGLSGNGETVYKKMGFSTQNFISFLNETY